MKKTSKSLAALFVALMVVLTMMIPGFAASKPSANATKVALTEGAQADIKVATGNAGDTLGLYKVIATTYDSVTNTLTHVFTAKFKDFLTANSKTLTVEQYAAYEDSSAELNAILGDFAAYVKANKVAADVEELAADGTATFADADLGQYIVVGMGNTNGTLVYNTVTAEVQPIVEDNIYKLYTSYDVTMKTTEPSIEKDITAGATDDSTLAGDDKETASLGDKITYELKIGVPTYPAGATNTTFFVGDALSNGLKLDPASIKVTGYTSTEDKDGTVLAASTAYTTDTTGATGNGGEFFVDFKYDQIKQYAFVIVSYDVTITDKAVLGTAGNPNTATLVFSNKPFDGKTWKPGDPNRPDSTTPGYGSKDDVKTVYTYALIIDKFEEKHEGEKLFGATFDVYLADPNGDVIPKSDNKTGNKVGTITTDHNGIATLERIEKGTYYLVETVAPSGYNLAEKAIEITIDSTNIPYATEKTTSVTHYTFGDTPVNAGDPQAVMNGDLVWINPTTGEVKTGDTADTGFVPAYVQTSNTVTQNVTTVSKDGAGTGFYKVNVSNSKGITIPSTGGIGTTIFYVVGGLLMVGAAIVLITKKRMLSVKN